MKTVLRQKRSDEMRGERRQKGGGGEKDWAEVHKTQCSSEEQEVYHLDGLVDLLMYIYVSVTYRLTVMLQESYEPLLASSIFTLTSLWLLSNYSASSVMQTVLRSFTV